jgi:hypothetical protein
MPAPEPSLAVADADGKPVIKPSGLPQCRYPPASRRRRHQTLSACGPKTRREQRQEGRILRANKAAGTVSSLAGETTSPTEVRAPEALIRLRSAHLPGRAVPHGRRVKHIKIRTLPLGVHRSAAAQISRIYAPYIYRLITGLRGQSEDPAGQQGKIIAAGQILSPRSAGTMRAASANERPRPAGAVLPERVRGAR